MTEQQGPLGDSNVTVDKGNTVSIETSVESKGVPPIVPRPRLKVFCSSKDSAEYTELLNTWIPFKTVTWTVGNFELTLDLPWEVIRTASEYPQVAPFHMYQYWRGDIEVKATVAGSPFAIGQLQMAWYYDANHDAYFDQMRMNKFARSMMMHTLVDASSSNDATLYIPFRSYRSYLQTRTTRADQGPCLNMGKLILGTLNSLSIPSGCTQSVSVILHIRFPNSEFQGRVPIDLSGKPI